MLYLSRYERVCLMRTRARLKWDYKSDLVLKNILERTDRGANMNYPPSADVKLNLTKSSL